MEARTTNASADRLPPAKQATRRGLMLRDGLKFVTLTAVALVLSGITTFLFRSFESHREALADRWSDRGQEDLEHGDSAQAVQALRTSLSYRPDDRKTLLSLAQALAAAGHTNEAENYFLNLWQSQPGDGLINLQLARLERSRGDAPVAINYYRAAVFGTWGGDALTRRRDTRLELARYLTDRGERQAARAELLIAAGNNSDAPTQLLIGEALEAAADPGDALAAYRNVAETAAVAHTADAKAGELCYRMGDYACASDLLPKALRYKDWTAEQKTKLATMRSQAERLQELNFSHDVAAPLRVQRLVAAGRMAQDRLKLCAASQSASDNSGAASLQPLQARWKVLDSAKSRSALRHDDDLQNQYAAFMYETEATVTRLCGAPEGDDALLVYLQSHPSTHFGAQ